MRMLCAGVFLQEQQGNRFDQLSQHGICQITRNLPVDVMRVAYKNRTTTVCLITFSHEAYTVLVLEIVSLYAICEFSPCLNERLKPIGYLLLVTFIIRIQVSVEYASM